MYNLFIITYNVCFLFNITLNYIKYIRIIPKKAADCYYNNVRVQGGRYLYIYMH